MESGDGQCHRICDPAQDAPFVASTMTISKGFGWEVHLEIDFKQNVQLGIFLLRFSAEKQQGIQYKTPLRKISSWTNCASIFYDQFLPANISVKMNEEAINGALWTATKYHSHSRPKAEIRWANCYLKATSRHFSLFLLLATSKYPPDAIQWVSVFNLALEIY